MKKKIQLVLALAIVVAAARTVYIFHERHVANSQQVRKAAAPLNPDYYVTPKKLYPYDRKSALQLTQQPVWAKVGYAYTYYSYNRADRHVEFARDAGLLRPIEQLQIKDVITAAAPNIAGRQVMAVFEKEGKTYAFSIGTVNNGQYQFYSDDMLFIQDPHQLYRYWPQDIWNTIDQHQVKPGMNELQVTFAIGLGIPQGSGDSAVKTLDYADGGKPMSITYRNGRVSEIRPGA